MAQSDDCHLGFPGAHWYWKIRIGKADEGLGPVHFDFSSPNDNHHNGAILRSCLFSSASFCPVRDGGKIPSIAFTEIIPVQSNITSHFILPFN